MRKSKNNRTAQAILDRMTAAVEGNPSDFPLEERKKRLISFHENASRILEREPKNHAKETHDSHVVSPVSH
jgi:hypothetical protein